MARQMHFDGQAVDELIHDAGACGRHELGFPGSADGTRPTSSSSAIAGRDFKAVVRLGRTFAPQAEDRHLLCRLRSKVDT